MNQTIKTVDQYTERAYNRCMIDNTTISNEALDKMHADKIQKMIVDKLAFSSHDIVKKVYLYMQLLNNDTTKQKNDKDIKWDKMDKKNVKVGMKVGVLENGCLVDSGRVIAIEDGFVSMVDGDEGFGYEMDSVEFCWIWR